MGMTIAVTGAAGFIGANVVRQLNQQGYDKIIAVDDLKEADKFKNLVDCEIIDYLDKREFIEAIQVGEFNGELDAILHLGACSDTMAQDGSYVMENNYRYSAILLDWCCNEEIQFIYASSAATYGNGTVFSEERENESPLNVYAYSKFLFDQVVRKRLASANSQIVGLRYFNVYGPREQHKGRMASVALHNYNQFCSEGRVKLFEGSHGYSDGEQCRDFVYVGDAAKINLFFLNNPDKSGIFNVGSGRAQSFNDVATATVNSCLNVITPKNAESKSSSLAELKSRGFIEYIPFPEDLKNRYQAYTKADLTKLRQAGYQEEMATVEEGVEAYVRWLATNATKLIA